MRRLPVCLALLPLVVAPGAAAQAPEQPLPPEVCCAPPPTVGPKAGKLTLAFRNGVRHRGRAFLTKGQRVKVRGRARPFVPGQYVRIDLRRNGRTVASKVRRLRKRGSRGQFAVRFRVRAKGRYVVRARHKRTRRQRYFSARESVRAVDNTAALGSRGIRVRLLQRGLKRLGYGGVGVHGRYGPGTARAVLAFRKVNRMRRITYASATVFRKVFERRGTFRLKYPRARKHVEADISRQVLVLAKGGRARRIYHMSSGKASTPTVLGSFRFYRKHPGTNSHGMVHSNYFIGGYAIHGYPSVPTYPASHGCLRVPIPNAWSVNSWIDLGDRIFVYR